jgi:hypothetical protein
MAFKVFIVKYRPETRLARTVIDRRRVEKCPR